VDRIDLPNSNAKLPRLFSPKAIVAAVVAVMSACVVSLVAWKAIDTRATALAQGERDIRNLTHSLAEHASHSIQAADVAICSPITDDRELQRSIREIVTTII